MKEDYDALIVFKARDTTTAETHYHTWIRLDRKEIAEALVELHYSGADVMSVIYDFNKYKGDLNGFMEQTKHTEEKNEKSLKDRIFAVLKEISESNAD